MSRRTGITTEQLRAAPAGALYIWPTDHSLSYPAKLAREVLGRTDLEFRTAAWLARNGPGLNCPVVIDHVATVHLSPAQAEEFRWVCEALRRRGRLT